MKTKTLTLLSAIALVACTQTETYDDSPTVWDNALRKSMDGLNDATAFPAGPILRSAALDKSWGNPRIETAADGSYRLSYANPNPNVPFERLVIYRYPQPLPPLTSPPYISSEEVVNDALVGVERPQSFKSINIMGQSVRWFTESTGGGADGEYHSTEGFTLTDPNGKTGHYRLVIETVSKAAPARFTQVSW